MIYEPNSPASNAPAPHVSSKAFVESRGTFEIVQKLLLIIYAIMAAANHGKPWPKTDYPQYPKAADSAAIELFL